MKVFAVLASAAISFAATAQSFPAGDAPLDKITGQPGFTGIFHSWGFIGDSLSSGEHESRNADGTIGYHDLYEYSWGQRICQATGAKGDNYSQGGETASGWIEHFWNNPNNGNNNIDAKVSPKQGYIIALGVNDFNRGDKAGNPDVDINLSDFTKNADTFAGNYGGIIQRVKSIQPEAKIFVVTTPRDGQDRKEFNGVIRKMADIFSNVYVIDLEKYAPDYSEGSDIRQNYYMGGHLSAAGYLLTSWIMMDYIDWIVRHNMDDFCQVAFIGTGLKY